MSQRGLRTPFIRIAKDGAVTSPSRYTATGGTGASIGDQVADDKVLELFAEGHTVVLQGLHRLWPPLIAFAGSLTTELGHPVQVNAYVTPSSSQGFSAHYDVHDVFVLQVAGRKRWRIHEPVLRSPSPDDPWTDHTAQVARRAAETPALDVELRPGDALYLPRGYLHSAVALGEVSAHVTVGVHPVTRTAIVAAVLDRVRESLTTSAERRASLPLGVDVSDPAAIETEVRSAVDALTARLSAVTAAEVADRLADSLVGSSRPAPIGPLAQATAAAELGAESVLAVRAHLRQVVRTVGDEVLVRAPGRTLRLPGEQAKAVRALLDGERLRVAELPGLDADTALALARALVTAGLVVVEGR